MRRQLSQVDFEVVDPFFVHHRYQRFICQPDLKKRHHEDGLRNQIISICESFIGCVQGSHITTCGQLYNHIQPVTNTMVDLLGLYHNYPNIVELILEFYHESARKMLCYLNLSASRSFYQQTVNLIQMYAHHNTVSGYHRNFFDILSAQ